MSTQSDISRGREAMSYFHNQASKYPGYNLKLDELLDKVGGGGFKTSNFLEGFGFAIDQVGLSNSKLQNAMENLADKGEGQIPSHSSAFFQSLSQEAQNINWIAASPEIALGVAKEAALGLAAGGESVIGVLKTMNVILPILVIGGVVFIAVSRIKKVAG